MLHIPDIHPPFPSRVPRPACSPLTTLLAGLLAGLFAAPAAATSQTDAFAEEREQMVTNQIEARGVTDSRVLEVMRQVPRHRFVPEALAELAYMDRPLPIGMDQTISQPYIVAYMVEAAGIDPGDRILEIGTGSGYGAAVLAELTGPTGEVHTIEILPELAERAGATLSELGYDHVQVRAGNGWLGWPEAAPFDAIVVTAAPDRLPEPLVEQLAEGGRIVVPVGDARQVLRVLRKAPEGLVEEAAIPVRFVPMVEDPEDGLR